MRRILTTVAIVATLASACGSSNSTASSSTTTVVPTTTAFQTTTVAPAPTTAASATTEAPATGQHIVSLSPTATEILFAIGAGDQVVAVDSLSNYPTDAPVTELSAFEPNVEAISGFDPDLVVTSYDPGDLVSGLSAIGVESLVQPAASSIADTYNQIGELGAATGHQQEASDLIDEIKSQLIDLVVTAPDGSGITYFHEIDSTLYTATSSTFLGEIYNLFGLENIADAADPDGSAFGFPQLSNEYIIDANPDLIFLADSLYSGETAESASARPGWDTITAVKNGNIIILNDDIASRWSPRIVQLAESIAAALESLSVAG